MVENLSKKDKAGLRQLIEKGVQAEYTNALNEVNQIIQQWQQGHTDNREAYQAMYKSIHENNKFIARRYDGMRGSMYVITVIGILRDGQITREDLGILSEELQQYILRVANVFS